MKNNRSGSATRALVRIAFVALLVLFGARDLAAQNAVEDSAAFRSWPHGEILWKRTRVAGRGSSLFGASFGFGLTPRTSVGGAGFQLHGSVLLGAPTHLRRNSLRLGYGGLMFERLAPLGGRWTAAASLLVGAGHATVQGQGIELGSDNFGVVEPKLAALWTILGPLQVTAGGGYRFTIGVKHLEGVRPSDLRSATFTAGIRLTGH